MHFRPFQKNNNFHPKMLAENVKIYENLLNSPRKSGHIKRSFGHNKRGLLCSKISGPEPSGHNKLVVILTSGHIKRGPLYTVLYVKVGR